MPSGWKFLWVSHPHVHRSQFWSIIDFILNFLYYHLTLGPYFPFNLLIYGDLFILEVNHVLHGHLEDKKITRWLFPWTAQSEKYKIFCIFLKDMLMLWKCHEMMFLWVRPFSLLMNVEVECYQSSHPASTPLSTEISHQITMTLKKPTVDFQFQDDKVEIFLHFFSSKTTSKKTSTKHRNRNSIFGKNIRHLEPWITIHVDCMWKTVWLERRKITPAVSETTNKGKAPLPPSSTETQWGRPYERKAPWILDL